MKKLLLSLTVMAIMAISPFANAADSASATLSLSGTIALQMEVSFSQPIKTDLALKNAADQAVGQIIYHSNSPAGFKIHFASREGSKLARDRSLVAGNADKISYSLRAAADAGSAAEPEVLMLSQANIESDIYSSSGAPVQVSQDLFFQGKGVMDSAGSSSLSEIVAGTYSDVVTAVISSN
jgi:hypothetical protein